MRKEPDGWVAGAGKVLCFSKVLKRLIRAAERPTPQTPQSRLPGGNSHSGVRVLRMPMEKECGGATESRYLAFMGRLETWRSAGQRQFSQFLFDDRGETAPGRGYISSDQDEFGGESGGDHAQTSPDVGGLFLECLDGGGIFFFRKAEQLMKRDRLSLWSEIAVVA